MRQHYEVFNFHIIRKGYRNQKTLRTTALNTYLCNDNRCLYNPSYNDTLRPSWSCGILRSCSNLRCSPYMDRLHTEQTKHLYNRQVLREYKLPSSVTLDADITRDTILEGRLRTEVVDLALRSGGVASAYKISANSDNLRLSYSD